MIAEDEISTLPPTTAARAFFRGFLIRLLYGSPALPIMLLIRPDWLRENSRILLLGALPFYLFICLAGGAYDATSGNSRRIRLFQKPRMFDILLLVCWLFLLWFSR